MTLFGPLFDYFWPNRHLSITLFITFRHFLQQPVPLHITFHHFMNTFGNNRHLSISLVITFGHNWHIFITLLVPKLPAPASRPLMSDMFDICLKYWKSGGWRGRPAPSHKLCFVCLIYVLCWTTVQWQRKVESKGAPSPLPVFICRAPWHVYPYDTIQYI